MYNYTLQLDYTVCEEAASSTEADPTKAVAHGLLHYAKVTASVEKERKSRRAKKAKRAKKVRCGRHPPQPLYMHPPQPLLEGQSQEKASNIRSCSDLRSAAP